MKREAVRPLVGLMAILAGLAIAVSSGQAQGIGVYPSTLELGDALRGGEYFKSIGILNQEDSDLVFRFESAGEVSDWVSLHPQDDRNAVLDELTVPARSEGRVLVRIAIPSDTPNGGHSGQIRATSTLQADSPQGSGDGPSAGTGIDIGVSVAIEVDITGTQSLTGQVLDMSISDTEVGYPLRIRTSFENTGNVQAQPQISLSVKTGDDSTVVGEGIYADTVIGLGENDRITTEWDTTGQDTGDYIASVSVSLGGEELDARDLEFKILPEGSLTRRGVFESLELANDPYPGAVAKIVGTFRNTGLIETRAKFLGELYYGSDLIEAVSSEELLTLVGELGGLEVFTRVDEEGEYTVRGKVNYEGKETEVKELTFRVGTGDGGTSIWVWIGIAAVVIVGAGAFTARRVALRRRGL